MPSIRVYPCPGPGGYRSIYPDLRDCPSYTEQIDMGAGSARQATRFLGAHSRLVSEAEYEALTAGPTPKPAPLNAKKLLGYALGAFALLALLIILAKKRRRK